MAVDYLKNYLNIDPNDYSAMESRISGEEPQAQAPIMMRQPMMMPQQRSLGDISAMPMMPRQQPTPQVDDRYQGLMDEIATLRSQIEGMQAPTEQAPVGAEAPVMADEPSMMDEQDVFSSWRNSPEKAAYDAKGFAQTMDYRPKNYTDPVTGQVFKLDDRSGTFADYYKNTYGRDLAVEDDRFRGSLGETQLNFGTEQPPQGSNNSFDYRQEMENTPPERPNYNSFRADPDTGFLQIQNPDAEGILKYGNDPRTLEFLKPQYDEYLGLFDSLQSRDRGRRYILTPEGREKRRQEEARFKDLYNMFGVIGTGGAYTPMQEGDKRPPIGVFMANQVYDKFAIDQPERTPPTQTEMPTTFQAFNPITGKMETLPIPANMQMPGMPSPGISGIPNPMTGETSEGMPYRPEPLSTPGYDTLSPDQPTQGLQVPVEIQNRMVGEPQPLTSLSIDPYAQGDNYVDANGAIYNPTPRRNVFEEANAPSQDIQQSIDYLAGATQPNLPNNFMGNSARNVMSQIQQPQMQSVGRPSTRLAGGFIPEMRAGGGGIDKAIYDLKFKLNG